MTTNFSTSPNALIGSGHAGMYSRTGKLEEIAKNHPAVREASIRQVMSRKNGGVSWEIANEVFQMNEIELPFLLNPSD